MLRTPGRGGVLLGRHVAEKQSSIRFWKLQNCFVQRDRGRPACNLVNARVFHPGSSGSPVIYTPQLPFPETTSRMLERPRLLGLVLQTIYERGCSLTCGLVGLAAVIPADRIAALIEQPDVQERAQLLRTELEAVENSHTHRTR